MAKHVIYVPGLGDQRTYGQPVMLKFWRLFGVKAHYLALGWHSQESFDKKLERLTSLIDELHDKHGSVALVGVSAGATAVLNAYAAKDNIDKVVCICGKINNPQTVGQRVYEYNPPFKESVYLLQKNLNKLGSAKRAKIMSVHPLEDHTVPPADTLIDGAVELVIPTKGHVFSIYFSIMFRARTICRFLKNT
ncbi:hypothetical protein KW792_02360 [Candidatus Saccharibacteria bacterium]|nr:hypothetical protein [Candidatus Saccharibacteria bacterium]